MTHSEHNETEAPVRAAEALSVVLAAFSIEQIAEGAIAALTADNSAISLRVSGLTFSVALLFTLVRFFHGNSIYIRLEYARWSHLEVPARSRFAPPIRYLFDVFVHILQYVAFVSAASLISKGRLDYAYCVVLVLLGFDAVWSGFLWLPTKSRSDDSSASLPDRTAPGRWCVINFVSLLVALALYSRLDCWIAVLCLAFVLILGFAADYTWNYDYFFNSRRKLLSVSPSQSRWHLEHIVVLYDSRDPSATLESQLRMIFAFFMDDPNHREEMFQRKKANLTVGIYVESDGFLRPLFRYHDKKITLANRSFPVGEHYIGHAFARLRSAPDEVRSYAQPDENRNESTSLGQKKKDQKQYQSSVMANIFLPGLLESSAIGTLTITADQPDYFTPALHDPWAIALAREVGHRLQSYCLAAGHSDVVQHVRLRARKPIIFQTGKTHENS